MPIEFIHLRVHSEYSLRDSTVRIPEKPEYGEPAKAKHANLVSRAVELGLPALALTDDSNLFAQIKFYRAAEKAGIKPIIGCDLWFANPEDASRPGRLTLLCGDHVGYLNLTRLISRAWLEGQHGGRALLQPDWLDGAVAGLFAIAGRDSAFGHLVATGREHDARANLDALGRHFDDGLYLELTRSGRDGEETFNAQALQLATHLGLPVIASNDVRFLDADDFEAHEARVCIQQGFQLADPRRPHDYSTEQWLKPAAAMGAVFADLPEVLENTVELAKRCNLELAFGKYYLPAFPVPEKHTLESWIGDQAHAGLEQRLAESGVAEGHTREDYETRLESELDVIGKMGFAGYFLIVADFIGWAKAQDIPVGPGRGSGASSVVAWSLRITDLDPLRFGLLFERFLNPERVSMPDFDVDFCMERRDEVIAYVAEKYGRDQVSQIITYGSMAAKAVLRDCGRVLGMPYGQVDKIAKLIPRMPLDLALGDALGRSEKSKREPDRVVREFCDLYREDDEARSLIDLALKLEGLARNAGKHAGGVVIAPTPLTDFAPLYSEPGGGGVVTQYDKNDVETVGLVKFDFLGLRTLTIIDWAVKAINASHSRKHSPHPASGHPSTSSGQAPLPQAGEGKSAQTSTADAPLDIAKLPLDDADVYRMFREARTVAVFQFEGAGMQRLLKDAKPDCFEDLIALNALFRPGPMELIPNYVARKRGREPVTYPDPRVEPVLRETFGIMVYQEQVMQMAQIVGGYSLGAADLLRRAMGKKVPAEMAKHRSIFRDGAMQSGVPERKADQIFDQMEKFAGYGFNKSHAAAYSLVAYQTAWLKTHYPAEFLAATMSADMDATDKLVLFIEDARAMGIAVLPPDVNASGHRFVANAEADRQAEPGAGGTIRYGLGAIKGVGRGVCEAIANARASGGQFRDLADFCARMDSGKLNKRVFEALIQSGAMDALGPNRATLAAQLPEAVKAAEQSLRDREAGQNDMFGAALTPVATVALATAPQTPWPLEKRLAGERATLGHYLSGHPTDPWREVLSQLATCPIGEIAQNYEPPPPRNGDEENRYRRAPETPWAVAGMIVKMRKRGDSAASVRIEDWTGAIEVGFFREALQQYGALLQPDAILVIEGGLGLDDYSGELQIRARRAWTLDEACEAGARMLRVGVNGIDAHFVGSFKRALAGHCGGRTPLLLTGYRNTAGSADLRLGDDWRVRVSTNLLRALAELPGVRSVQPSLSRPADDL